MPNILQIWSFEKTLTDKDKEELLKHFGAVNVKHVARHGKNVVALASFKSNEDCEYALQKLHQLEVLGVRLMAIYKNSSALSCSEQPHRSKEETKINESSQQEKIRRKMREFESHLSAIGPNVGITHPIPPHLRYLYPPPSPSVVANIAQTLVAVPKFYTQVLHLMNKMNLPIPFGPLKTLPPIYAKVLKLIGYSESVDRMEWNISECAKNTNEVESNSSEFIENESKENHSDFQQDTTETESELESDGGESFNRQKQVTLPVRRKLKPKNTINKKPKLSLLKQTSVCHPRNLDLPSVKDVFEANESQGPRKMQLKLQGTVLPQVDMESERDPLQPGGFGKMESPLDSKKTTDDMVEWKRESAKYITKEELHDNIVNKTDWPLLTVFKNYKSGEPSTKLYIKNLAKTTNEKDLKYIYGRYIFWQNEEEANGFSIRLMKEGRMKGQAFVTFPSVKQASEALEDTNGFILNDKPMVVAFGKVKTAE